MSMQHKNDRRDQRWRMAAQNWLQIKRKLNNLELAEKEARNRLIKLAPAGARGSGVRLTHCHNEGRVNWKEALQTLVPNADVSPFQGEPFESYRLEEDE